jgi:hypothetical protein
MNTAIHRHTGEPRPMAITFGRPGNRRDMGELTRKVWRLIARTGEGGISTTALYQLNPLQPATHTQINGALQTLRIAGHIAGQGMHRWRIWRCTGHVPEGEAVPQWVMDAATVTSSAETSAWSEGPDLLSLSAAITGQHGRYALHQRHLRIQFSDIDICVPQEATAELLLWLEDLSRAFPSRVA